uniref:F-box domain and ankyrin repeat protein n=1 Tax=Pithovirus LCPAC202 TaxID=2506592 RepID=A0A481Z6I1_9VIRU|nr:MAG: F-box domain and ankyrin repeat protein [Pithovirus LCPAC202]
MIKSQEPPLSELPAEIKCMILKLLPNEGKVFIALTCKIWYLTVLTHCNKIWKSTISGQKDWEPSALSRFLTYASGGGNLELMKKLKKLGAECYSWTIYEASEHGQIEAIKLLNTWRSFSDNIYEKSLLIAASRGQTEMCKFLTNKVKNQLVRTKAIREAAKRDYTGTMKFLKTQVVESRWQILILDDAMMIAAGYGRLKSMKLLKEWGVVNLDSAFYLASSVGQIEAMKLLKEWGVTDFDGGFNTASEEGQIEAMKLLREWDNVNIDSDYDYDGALTCASKRGQTKAMKLLRIWGLKIEDCEFDYENSLSEASKTGQIKAMKLLKKWGAKDFSLTMMDASDGNQIEALLLLREWGGEGFDSIMINADLNDRMEMITNWNKIDHISALIWAREHGSLEAQIICKNRERY